MKSKNHSFITMLILKILGISILLIFGITLVVKGENLDLKSVKIVFDNGSEVNIITTKSIVEQILSENHIILQNDETTTPKPNELLNNDNKIIIYKTNPSTEKQEIIEQNIDLNTLNEDYLIITEKILTLTEEIPFETIQKNIAGNASDTTNKVVQEGQNGLKETKYRIKYKGEVEISKEEISCKIIKEPVNKIIQIVEKPATTSRSTSTTRTSTETTAPVAPKVTGSKAEYQAYAKERCKAYGWTDNDFNSLVALWNRESGWNPTSKNKYSGAYGIPQALPAKKMASAGADYLTNYKTQINWGLNYIKGRYGSPSKAYAAFKQKGWY